MSFPERRPPERSAGASVERPGETEAPAPRPRSAARRRGAIVARVVTRLVLGVALSLGTLVALILALSFLSEPSTLSVIEAESETVSFTVANPGQASFQIRGFRIFGEGDFDGECVGDALGAAWSAEPQIDVQVVYSLITHSDGDRRLLVEMRGFEDDREAVILRGRDESGAPSALSVPYDVALRDDPDCGPRAATRLPIWGAGEIGGAPTFRADGPAPTLISGSLEMYGRAVPYNLDVTRFFGGDDPSLARAMSDDRSLYASLTSAFQIPPGSRVSTLVGEADPALKALRGFAIPDDGAAARTLTVNVSTESPEVFFFPPGAGTRPDRLKMSLLSQIGNDPNIQRILQIIVWFVVVLPIALEILRPLFARPDEHW